ncbi:MAG: HNH endonuclease signature motif containing protein [Burkholderiaceae bacterium]
MGDEPTVAWEWRVAAIRISVAKMSVSPPGKLKPRGIATVMIGRAKCELHPERHTRRAEYRPARHRPPRILMKGRIRRRQIADAHAGVLPAAPPRCPICERPIPPSQADAHHWVPKSHGGRVTDNLHRICHRQIHALFSERELATEFHDPQVLRAHPLMRRFIDWVSRKPDHFEQRVARSARLRS